MAFNSKIPIDIIHSSRIATLDDLPPEHEDEITTEEQVNAIVDTKLDSLEHPVQSAHFETEPTQEQIENLKDGAFYTVGSGEVNGFITGGNTDSIPELTEEHIVATLNGKPVYEKIVPFSIPSSADSTVTVYTATSENIDKLISYSQCYMGNNDYYTNNYNNAATNMLVFKNTEKLFQVQTAGTNIFKPGNGFIKFQYTKTTD